MIEHGRTQNFYRPALYVHGLSKYGVQVCQSGSDLRVSVHSSALKPGNIHTRGRQQTAEIVVQVSGVCVIEGRGLCDSEAVFDAFQLFQCCRAQGFEFPTICVVGGKQSHAVEDIIEAGHGCFNRLEICHILAQQKAASTCFRIQIRRLNFSMVSR